MRWLVILLAVACGRSGSSDIERRYDDLGEVQPGKASVIGSVHPGSLLLAPMPAPDMLRDGVTVLARGRITHELVLEASELRVLVCAGALRDPLCPK